MKMCYQQKNGLDKLLVSTKDKLTI